MKFLRFIAACLIAPLIPVLGALDILSYVFGVGFSLFLDTWRNWVKEFIE